MFDSQYLPLVRFYDAVHDAHSQTGAGLLRRIEVIEDSFSLLGVQAGTVINHGNLNGRMVLQRGFLANYLNARRIGACCEGIVEKVMEHLF